MRDVDRGGGQDVLPRQLLERLTHTGLVVLDGEYVVKRPGFRLVIDFMGTVWTRVGLGGWWCGG